MSDIIIKEYDVYMSGHPAVIEKLDTADAKDTDLKITYTDGGESYTVRYASNIGAVVYGGVKDIEANVEQASLTLKSGQVAALIGGSKVNSAKVSSLGSVKKAVINIQGGLVCGDAGCTSQPYQKAGMVMASWYWGPNVDEFEFNMTGGEVRGSVYGGAATSTNVSYENGSFNASVSGGKISTLWCGSYATKGVQTLKSANVEISGDAKIDTIYGGGFANWNTVKSIVKTTDIKILGGTVGSVYAGGQNGTDTAYNNSSVSQVNAAKITVDGGTVGVVYGGGHNYHWNDRYWIDDNYDVVKMNYNASKQAEYVHYSDVGTVTLNINSPVDTVYAGGRSWAHVGTAITNINADVKTLSAIGSYGYVENSTININEAAAVDELSLVRSGIAGNVTVSNNGSIGTFYVGAPENCYIDNMGVNHVAVLGDVNINNSGSVGNALLTYGTEFANSVTSNVPATVTAVSYGKAKEGTSAAASTRDDSVWNAEVEIKNAGTSFTDKSSAESELKINSAASSGNVYYGTVSDAAKPGANVKSKVTNGTFEQMYISETLISDLVNSQKTFYINNGTETVEKSVEIPVDGEGYVRVGLVIVEIPEGVSVTISE